MEAWLRSLPAGELRTHASEAACRPESEFIEASADGSVVAYIAYVLGPGGAHWHHAFVEPSHRKAKLATRLFNEMIRELSQAFGGAPFDVTAWANTTDGAKLLERLQFVRDYDNTYTREFNTGKTG
jgi:GNAT superfamily N-acetyltransferase